MKGIPSKFQVEGIPSRVDIEVTHKLDLSDRASSTVLVSVLSSCFTIGACVALFANRKHPPRPQVCSVQLVPQYYPTPVCFLTSLGHTPTGYRHWFADHAENWIKLRTLDGNTRSFLEEAGRLWLELDPRQKTKWIQRDAAAMVQRLHAGLNGPLFVFEYQPYSSRHPIRVVGREMQWSRVKLKYNVPGLPEEFSGPPLESAIVYESIFLGPKIFAVDAMERVYYHEHGEWLHYHSARKLDVPPMMALIPVPQ